MVLHSFGMRVGYECNRPYRSAAILWFHVFGLAKSKVDVSLEMLLYIVFEI